MEAIIAAVGVILVQVLTLVIKYQQDKRISERQEDAAAETAEKVEGVRKTTYDTSVVVDEKLDVIHTLVNSRLTEALTTISDLKVMLKELAPRDKRVKEMTASPGGMVKELAMDKPVKPKRKRRPPA